MKKKYIYAILLCVISLNIFAQNDYYWYNNRKVFLKKSNSKKFILFKEYNDSTSASNMIKDCNLKITRLEKTNVFNGIKPHKSHPRTESQWAYIEGDSIQLTSKLTGVSYEAPSYITSNNEVIGLSHIFYLKLKKIEDLSLLEKIASENNVEILGSNIYMPLWYTLACSKNSRGNSLQMANLFYESQLFSSSEPDFIPQKTSLCVNDTYFNNQWNLYNTCQNDGVTGIDIKFCQAQQMTKGNSNIIIALIDEGTELNHPDITGTQSLSFDAVSMTSPSHVYGSHGTACAGIISSKSNNNLGISGIAPDCKLMDISCELYITNNVQQRANAINYAWQNGASIISNSWYYSFYSSLLNDAIYSALQYGRNGLGCTIVFGIGNNDEESASYPANLNSNIIVVGAINQWGERKSRYSLDGEPWGSNYGSKLDIMAPGVLIPALDRQGIEGYVSGDYNLYFNGTSSACPQVAATAALILSVNPNLNQLQVTNIIESTAQKIGNYNYTQHNDRTNGSWNNEMGYGLLDVNAAIESACPLQSIMNQTVTSDTHIDGCRINLQNIVVQGNANLAINSGLYTLINGTFEVQTGAEFSINP